MYYPSDIRRISDTVQVLTDYKNTFKIKSIAIGPKKLKLAKGYLEFETMPNWQQSFDEQEQFFSLHRWNWLLFSLTDQQKVTDFEWGESLIRSWLSEMTPLPMGDASESYSVGERVSNACLFFRHIGGSWDNMPGDILTAVHVMALHLSQRIEYYSGDLSGNHVVNNSRAILFAGYCCNDNNLTLLGRAVLQDQLPKLIDKYGFLREGSSHYQFLMTRWILEIRMMAIEVDDMKTLEIIQPLIPKMLSACDLFLINKADGEVCMPTIGDVSPDCSPEWLLDLLNSPLSGLKGRDNSSKGWASLFSDFNNKHVIELPKKCPLFSNSSWGRVDFKDWTAIWHMEDPSGSAIASHAHHDFASFVLFLNGEKVLIDPGRYNYEGSEIGRYAIEACSHNTIQLNGLPPMLSKGDRILPEIYRNSNYSVSFSDNVDSFLVTIKHDGFNRIASTPILHTREFIFTSTTCKIEDCIEGNGEYFFESFMQWPFKADDTALSECFDALGIQFDLVAHKNKIEMDCNIATTNPVSGWQFPSYLEKIPCTTQRFFGDVKLPLKLNYRIAKK
tara:strand:- start:378 stop:2054 length:1677 start_codon:yes stop_codon:yes gene_type:complete